MISAFPPFLFRSFCCSLVFGVITPSSRALLVLNAPASHAVDPANGVPWGNVGSLNGATGVYLGAFATGYWVITTSHVGLGDITLAGQTYAAVPGSAQQISNAGRLGPADLLLFRLQSAPPLPNLSLPAGPPAVGTPLLMIGYGGGIKNWGTNTVLSTGFYPSPDPANAYAVLTDYSPVTGEAQGTVGDSGGAMFFQNGKEWVLGGIMESVTTAGLPLYTLSIDLGAYRSQIFTMTGGAMPKTAGTTVEADHIDAGRRISSTVRTVEKRP